MLWLLCKQQYQTKQLLFLMLIGQFLMSFYGLDIVR